MAGKCYRRADEKVPKRTWPAHFGAGRTVHLSRHEMEFVMEKTKAYQVFVDGGLVSQSEALDAVYEDLMELRHAEAFMHNAANQERESGNSPALPSYVVRPESRSKGLFQRTICVTIIISVLSFVVIFGLMVFAHEFGHFIVAKKAGVHVREFGFGFPLGPSKPPSKRPLTWKIAVDKSGTIYTINLVPFGGFVSLGENDPDDPRSLPNFSKRIRLAALVAGPAMNIVLAFIIFALAAMVGYPEFLLGVGIIEVSEGSPAEKAGLRANDIVLRVGDLELDRFLADLERAESEMVGEMVEYTAARAGQSIAVLVQRGLGREAERLEFVVIPYADENGEGKMGIVISAVPVRLQRVNASLFGALKYGAGEVFYTIQMTISIPIQVIRGLLPAHLARSVGPVGIAKLTGNAVQQSIDVGWAFPILQLTGILNVAIAITNLLPLPALDGGRILFVLLEAIRGKPLPPRKEGLAHSIGLVLLLLFFVVVTLQDIFVPLPQGVSWVDYLY